MAFATANVRKGAFGDLKVMAGDWTGSAGDANGTLNVEGGRVYLAKFDSQDSNNGPEQEVPVFISTNPGTGVITLSVANRQTVTTGRFLIIGA